MKKLNYQIDIQAPKEKVFENMIGKDTFKQWTAEFNPTSDFEGSWNKGDKILFTGEHEGKRGGMVAEIAENIPNAYISIRHLGVLEGDKEIMSRPEVEGWAGALENYSFEENNGVTTVKVDVDTNGDHIDYFNESWPKALNKLKEIIEN